MTRRYRWVLLLAIYAGVLAGGWAVGQWLPGVVDLNISPRNEPLVHKAIMTTMAVYVLASALPFVPGAEIGFGLIMLFGGKIAVLIYLGMLSALLLAFIAGRHMPLDLVAAVLRKIGFKRADDFINKLIHLNPQERLALLIEHAPRRIIPTLLHHRYLALMVIMNLPGNSVIGGGGGIALIAGLSGLFSYLGFLAAMAVAVAPVPVFFLLTR